MPARVSLLVLLAGCSLYFGGTPDQPPPADDHVEVALVSVTINRDLDVLFVVDDSPGILGLQSTLEAAFPAFVTEMQGLEGGLANVHIGVVTSDVGTMGALDAQPGPAIGSGPGACAGTGKSGNLQTNGTTLVTGTFISEIENIDGSRTLNYTGTLANALSAITAVGTNGCGFEQHVEAARRALHDNPANAGFLRPSANLAVVVVGDEDDCSIAHSTLMGTDAALGPLQSFRCTRFGVTCDQGGRTSDEMNMPGTKSGCHSNDASPYLMPMAGYADDFKRLKTGTGGEVMFAAIVGDPRAVTVELRTPVGGGTPIPALAHSCAFDTGIGPEVADPAVRLGDLAAKFGTHGMVANACTSDLGPTMSSIARQMRALTGDTCLLRDIALPADCEVFDLYGGLEVQLPPCTSTVTMDCQQLVEDPSNCSGQHLRIKVNRSKAPSPDTKVSVRCRL
jgi:hypothetical protein